MRDSPSIPAATAQKMGAPKIKQTTTTFLFLRGADPADAGTLSLSVVQGSNALLGNSLNLQGNVQTAAATGGRGALINISAPNLEVSANGTASTPDLVAVS